ncbi:hypothetical protein L211DRAFT_849583 [Terfezia boudieri ATCC MYA-4762]|uniref:Uncharacterized protein n=1 Tax=Terfezia boudieri ATCC MYA-4762 TaxID=1051890 RepID=A0A3N4LQQ3_9PEZI|nr:hypothetical protein L211DRAFT_849583 [Terfezia boudieri ATCC MYA-4762]
MGKNDKLFFSIRQGWDTNKVAAIIDGKAYRTLGSYSVWGASGGRPDIRKHIDAISKGAILFDSDNAALPSRIEVIEPAHLDTLIESGKAALVALVPEDQQMNDTINVLPHTTCQVSYCNKPLQPTTPEEDVDMLLRLRGERESAPSPKPDADPNLYSAELLNLKQERTPTERQEMQDPELEEVLNKELTGMTVEDRVIELRLALEDDQARRKEEKEEERELREKEISDLMCYIGELQKEYREGHGEVMGALAIQVKDIREALSLLNRHMANQIKSLSKQVAELMTQLIAPPLLSPPPPPPPVMSTGEIRHRTAGTVIPDSTESTRESSPAQSPTPFPFHQLTGPGPITTPIGGLPAQRLVEATSQPPPAMSECFYTTPTGERHHMTIGPMEEAAEILARADKAGKAEKEAGGGNQSINICDTPLTISDDPEKDSCIKDNEAVNNRETSNRPLEDVVEAEVTAALEARHVGGFGSFPPGCTKGEATRRTQITPEHTRPTPTSIPPRTNATPSGSRQTIPGTGGSRNASRQTTPRQPGRRQATPKQDTREKEKDIERVAPHQSGRSSGQTTPGTGANATPVGPPRNTPRQTAVGAIVEAEVTAAREKKEKEGQVKTHLVEGKPGRVQRTHMGEGGYWNRGPENTADISPPPSRPTSVQVLITGCPSIPARGDEWKRSFLAGFNARRERLAPETPICATHVAFALSYPSERVVTIHHPADMKHEEIIRAVARVHREMYNNYIQHPNQSLISILQETTELVAPGLQGTRGEKAWDRADGICKDLKLVRAARPPKWLVKGKGDGYEGKKCSLRFSVTTASLRAIKSPLPIVHNNKSKIYLYQRVGDKAFYVDELKYMAFEPRPSHSPEPVQTWGACTYCHKLNHTEDTCWSKKNAIAWKLHNKYEEAAVARNYKGNATRDSKPRGNTRAKVDPANV